MSQRPKWVRILAISCAGLGLLMTGCIGVTFYQIKQWANGVNQGHLLADAAYKNDLPAVKRLLAEGASPNYQDNWTPLDMAVGHDNLEMVKLLLQHGAKTNYVNYSMGPILFMAQSDAVFNLLLEHGADANARISFEGQESILNVAIRNTQVNKVRGLLAHGADPYWKNSSGQSAFDLVPVTGVYSSKEQEEIVNLLHAAVKKRRSP